MRSIVIVGLLAAVVAAGVGEDLAHAQKKGDIVAVQRLLATIRDDWREARRNAGARTALWTAEALHKLMMRLDAKRAGAFVSAPCMARDLLLMATASGDTKFVADSVKVIRAHAKQRGAGKCAKAMALYAEGMEARIAKDDAKAAASFQKALVIMRDEGWTPLAMHAAVESAAVKVRQRDAAGAATAIAGLAKIFPAGSDVSLSYVLRELYTARLKDAPEGVKAAFDKVMAPHTGPRTVRSAGGKGGAGGRGGGPRESKVGAALHRFSKRKALMTVWRVDVGFEIRQGFDKRFAARQSYKDGTKYHENGGVTLGFWNYAVGLNMIDRGGRQGQPGESSTGPDAVRAYYFLGRKEKWTVTRTGVVAIK